MADRHRHCSRSLRISKEERIGMHRSERQASSPGGCSSAACQRALQRTRARQAGSHRSLRGRGVLVHVHACTGKKLCVWWWRWRQGPQEQEQACRLEPVRSWEGAEPCSLPGQEGGAGLTMSCSLPAHFHQILDCGQAGRQRRAGRQQHIHTMSRSAAGHIHSPGGRAVWQPQAAAVSSAVLPWTALCQLPSHAASHSSPPSQPASHARQPAHPPVSRRSRGISEVLLWARALSTDLGSLATRVCSGSGGAAAAAAAAAVSSGQGCSPRGGCAMQQVNTQHDRHRHPATHPATHPTRRRSSTPQFAPLVLPQVNLHTCRHPPTHTTATAAATHHPPTHTTATAAHLPTSALSSTHQVAPLVLEIHCRARGQQLPDAPHRHLLDLSPHGGPQQAHPLHKRLGLCQGPAGGQAGGQQVVG